MTEDERHAELVARLDVLIRLQAGNLVSGLNGQREKMLVLSRAGLTPKIIAEILGTTPNTVSVTLSKAKRSGAQEKGAAEDVG